MQVQVLLRSFQSLAMTSDEKLYIILPAFVEIKNRKAKLIFCPLLLVYAYSSSILPVLSQNKMKVLFLT